jgi:hypothetical protein
MGIRFACHLCSHPLNVKNDLAGRVGVCPKCRGKFRIPLTDSPSSQPLQQPENAIAAGAAPSATFPSAITPKAAPGPGDPSPERPSVLTAGGEPVLDQPVGAAPDVSPGEAVSAAVSPPEESAAQWYVRPPAGGQYGPATGEVMRLWMSESRITPSTLVWRDGWPQWKSAREVFPELGGGTTTSASPVSSLAGQPDLARSLGGRSAGTPAGFSTENRGDVDMTEAASGLPKLDPGNPKLDHLRGARDQRRLALIVGLALLSILLVAVLIVLALRGG